MPIPTYTPGYPPDGASLGQTKSTMRNNLDGTFQTLAIDHIDNNGSPGSKPAGYHKVIHQVTQTSVGTIGGVNQVFSGIPGALVVNGVTTKAIPSNGDTQLYALSSSGFLSQLTGFSGTTDGFVWCGGILFQWGIVNSPGQTGSVAFSSPNVNFPNNCFNVSLTLRRDGGTSTGSVFINGMPATTGFSYTGSTSSSNALYWFAIGN